MKTLKIIKILTIALSFYILTPVILLAFVIPNFIFRTLVRILKQILRKDLEGIVTPLGNLFGIDKLYSKPTSTLIMASIYTGIITKELVCQLVLEKWLNKRDLNGNLQYPELRQGLHSWLGYQFWGTDNSFSIYNHVKVLDARSEFFQRENVSEMFVRMVNEPFKVWQSPWEILILPYYCNNSSGEDDECTLSTLVFFRVHHTLMDGFSIMKLGQRDLGNIDTNSSSKSYHNEDFGIAMKFAAAVRLPYFAAKYFVNEKGVTDQMSPREGKQVKMFTVDKINLEKIKQIKSKYNCSVTSILLSGYTAAIRHFLIKKNKNCDDQNSTPTCVIPVPLPNHPEKLRNHMSFVSVNLPVHEINSCRRLQAIHMNLDSARKSLDPLCMYYALTCVGSFPSFAVKLFLRKSPVSLLFSNFPGLFLPLKIGGHLCTEIFFNGGLLEGNINMVCSCVGYENVATLTVSTNDHFLEFKHDAEEFMQIMMKEFDFLSC